MMANRAQMCAIFGWSPREFDRNVTLGLPAKKRTSSRGDTWSVDTVAAVTWIVAQAVGEQGDGADPLDVNAERARLLRSQANISEFEEARRRGEVLPAGEVVEGWQAAIARARSLLLGLPPAAADGLVSLARRASGDEAAVPAVRERLADLIHGALSELANTTLDDVEQE
jgi:phage terminase Nu1 subunit (DNA packaging protein)